MQKVLLAVLLPLAEVVLMDATGFSPEMILWALFATLWTLMALTAQNEILSKIGPLDYSDRVAFYIIEQILIGLLAILVSSAVFAPICQRMYLTGRYGEPPGNRYATIVVSRKTGSLIFEFGVRHQPVSNPTVGFYSTDAIDARIIDTWVGPPGSHIKPSNDVLGDPITRPSDIIASGSRAIRGRAIEMLYSLTPKRSFYMRVALKRSIPIPIDIGCAFSTEEESAAGKVAADIECKIRDDD